ncbi:MAG: DUF3667 domain-containing protein [Bacteroidota bacterium]
MKIRRKTNLCPNCSAQLNSIYNYCPLCGQENTNNYVSFKLLIADFFNTFFALDSRIAKSIKPFLFKPGFLTNHYVDGKRMAYAHPLRLYFILSLFFFFVFSKEAQEGFSEGWNNYASLDEVEGIDSATLLIITSTLNDNELADLEEELNGNELGDLRSSIRNNLSLEKKSELAQRLDSSLINKLKLTPEDLARETEKDSIKNTTKKLAREEDLETDSTEKNNGFFDVFNEIDEVLIDKYKDNPRVTDEQLYDSLEIENASDFQRHLVLQVIKVKRGNENALAELILENLPLMMLALIPIFGLVLKLFYIRRGQLYIKHVIHALHLHSFAYFLYGASTLITIYLVTDEGSGGWVLNISFIVVSIYSYVSFLSVYKQHWFKTLFKFNAVGFIYLIFIFAFFLAEIIISFALF